MTTRKLDLIDHPRSVDLPTERLDATLPEVGQLLKNDGHTDQHEYEAAADRFFAAIRAAAPGD